VKGCAFGSINMREETIGERCEGRTGGAPDLRDDPALEPRDGGEPPTRCWPARHGDEIGNYRSHLEAPKHLRSFTET
jgi:hypothetical protein